MFVMRDRIHRMIVGLALLWLMGCFISISPAIAGSGDYQWHTFYGSGASGSMDTGWSSATDSDGNTYITGPSGASWTGPNGEQPLNPYSAGNFYVLKLDKNGNYLWHTFYGAPLAPAYALTLDNNGNVYITGTSYTSWNGPLGQTPINAFSSGGYANDSIFVLKLDSNGTYLWHTFYGADADSRGFAIAKGSDGSIYVTGNCSKTFNGPTGQHPLNAFNGTMDICILKLGSDGSYQWHTFYGAGSDYGYGIGLDSSDNIYVAGTAGESWNGPAGQTARNPYEGGTQNGAQNIVVLKLASNGTYQWHSFYGGSSASAASDISISNGNVYIVASSNGSWNGPSSTPPLHAYAGSTYTENTVVLKLDNSGVYQWHTFYGGSSGTSGIASYGAYIYVSGASANWNGPSGQAPVNNYHGNSANNFVLKLDTSGSYMWHTFQGENDWGNKINVVAGNIYLVGSSNGVWTGPTGQPPLHSVSGSGYEDIIFALKLTDSLPSAVWKSIPGAIVSAPALAWNPVSNKIQMVVRGSNDTIWSATFNSDGSFNGDWTQIPGAIVSPPALAWNPSSNKLQMVVRGSGDTIWTATFNSNGSFNGDWTQIPGAIISPPALAWNPVSNKLQMVVRGSGDTIWTATFNSNGSFNGDWTQIPGAIISPPALVWNSLSNEAQLVVQGSSNTIWSATFDATGTFNSDWTQIPGAIISPPALAWDQVSNSIQMLVRGSNDTVWTATFNSTGAFNGDWTQIPGAIIDPPAIVWNSVKGNLLIVVRGTNNSIWAMEY